MPLKDKQHHVTQLKIFNNKKENAKLWVVYDLPAQNGLRFLPKIRVKF